MTCQGLFRGTEFDSTAVDGGGSSSQRDKVRLSEVCQRYYDPGPDHCRTTALSFSHLSPHQVLPKAYISAGVFADRLAPRISPLRSSAIRLLKVAKSRPVVRDGMSSAHRRVQLIALAPFGRNDSKSRHEDMNDSIPLACCSFAVMLHRSSAVASHGPLSNLQRPTLASSNPRAADFLDASISYCVLTHMLVVGGGLWHPDAAPTAAMR